MYKQTILDEEQVLNLNLFMEMVDTEEREQVADFLGHTTITEFFDEENTGYEWL